MELWGSFVTAFEHLHCIIVGVDVGLVDLVHVRSTVGPDFADQRLRVRRVPVLDDAAKVLEDVVVDGNEWPDFVEDDRNLAAVQKRHAVLDLLFEWRSVNLTCGLRWPQIVNVSPRASA